MPRARRCKATKVGQPGVPCGNRVAKGDLCFHHQRLRSQQSATTASSSAIATHQADPVGGAGVDEWHGFSARERRDWTEHGFTPKRAQRWAEYGFDPDAAKQFEKVGQTPFDYQGERRKLIADDYGWARSGEWERRNEWERAGVHVGRYAGQWARKGKDPRWVHQWSRLGFDTEQGSVDILYWDEQGFTPDEAANWSMRSAANGGAHFDWVSASRLRAKGWTPEAASEELQERRGSVAYIDFLTDPHEADARVRAGA